MAPRLPEKPPKSQGQIPYAAVPTRASSDSRSVRYSLGRQETGEVSDFEDNDEFLGSGALPDAMEVSDNDTLYYGVSLGTRRRMGKGKGFWVTVVALVTVSMFGVVWLYFDGISWMRRSKKRNVILMISDGFGPASETMARNFWQQTHKLPVGFMSPLDEILVGSSRTRSSSSLVTDSAAGATAFSCGLKSYNGAIGVMDNQAPCGTVLEAAKLQRKMRTGLVATSRITHATPAAFSSHVMHRDMEDLIAEYQIGNYSLGPAVDLMFGGGRCHFNPQSAGAESCRLDNRDLWSEAKQAGFRLLKDRKEFDKLEAKAETLPVLGSFALSHMDYDIDRNPTEQPSLAEMSDKALRILQAATKDSDSGFFLMIEGSRIDMAAHTNDPAAHVRDIIAYWDAVAVVRKFVDEHPDTVVISVSDHETGGFSVAKQLTTEYPEYLWNPHALEPVKHSIEFIAPQILALGDKDDAKYTLVRDTVFPQWLGVPNATHDEISAIAKETDSVRLRQLLSDAESSRAQLGWSTHGHSAVDVNLYAHGKDAHLLAGNHENTDIGHFIIDMLGLDLQAVTSLVRSDRVRQETAPVKEAWLGRRDLDAADHYPHLH
ncbi:vacuolar alkaline phosphatase [Linderina macrospora]|uniref:Vacuolar alkaline phosphatase n=1 Tax=Linderina macrospora TaxID=4868 RepID=A0ACC1JG58_9FUNG|nr:vacuolar alkaline phosphatase [Linderina macrospora]